MSNGQYVRLWGMLRDLEATGRKRPTWLGVELVNQAVQGDMLVTVQGGDNPSWHQSVSSGVENEIDVNYVQSFAFRDGARYSVVLFNLHLDEAQRVRLALPAPPKGQAMLHQIAPSSIHADNEDTEEVTIQTQLLDELTNLYELDLPAHSVTALTWEVVALDLTGAPADRAIHLDWTVNITLPSTHTWQINYGSETGTAYLPITGIVSPTRAYTLTNLTNYVWYTVTLNAMLDASPILTDTVRVMPTGRFVCLPLVMR